MHYCAYHQIEHEDDAFRVTKTGALDSWCIEGRREYNRAYSEKRYAPKKAENAKKRAQPVTHKVCTNCKERKPLVQFPKRYDRPGKIHAQCRPCRRAWEREKARAYNLENFDKLAAKKKEYHAAHPRYNDQSSRNRRARMERIRTDPFTREEIRERDKGLCWFCRKPVDPTLKWPDVWSEVVHHIHPVSKKGSNSRHNVAIAHLRCNGRHKNNHDCPFEGWEVKEIDPLLARTIAKEKHYLKRAPNASYAFGLFAPDDELHGIVTFGTPTSMRISRSVLPDDRKRVIELSRLWIDDNTPFGAASWLVSRALKRLPPMIVVSYADTAASDTRNGRQHDGTVYRALSFNYAGRSKASTDWRLPGSTRNVGKNTPGAEPHTVSPKERYWTVTGNKRDKRILRAVCEWPSMPYDA